MEGISEIERIKEVYGQRRERVPSERYSFFNDAHLFIAQGRDREIIKALKRSGMSSLEGKRILDIGCGAGAELRNFLRYGARPEDLSGIDLLSDRIETAKRVSPNIDFRCSSAECLPFGSECFDIVMQFTVFTSILDRPMKNRIASEMLRVLKPGGVILWYDYFINNPKNPDVRGVGKKEIGEMFPRCRVDLKRITLAPPVTRAMASRSAFACYMLERMQIFNTHYMGIIRKDESHESNSISHTLHNG